MLYHQGGQLGLSISFCYRVGHIARDMNTGPTQGH